MHWWRTERISWSSGQNSCRENLLEGYRAEKFIEYTDGAEPLTEMDTDFMLKTLDHIKVFEDGTLLVVFLDGTKIECKNEEEDIHQQG